MSKVASKLNKKIQVSKKSKNIKIKVKSKSVARATTRVKAKVHKAAKKVQEKELIVVDEAQGLIFDNEKTLFGYFSEPIKELESKFTRYRSAKDDFTQDEMNELEYWLEPTLDDPDEIWEDLETFVDTPIYTLIKNVENVDQPFSYVSVVYLESTEKSPTFVFIHFASRDQELVETFRQKEIIYHRKLEAIQFAAIDGDSLLEGDYLAIGLLESMMKLRSEKDILAGDFKKYAEFREETINSPDEIWRKLDTEGHVLVTFIKDCSENSISDLHYVVVTEEDQNSQVHSLLFSFPSTDSTLLDRYRQGENLEAEEVSTENSH